MSGFQRDGVIETRKTFILNRETLSQHASGPSDSPAGGQGYGSTLPLPDPLLRCS
jgi:hypothetical protein